MKKLTYLLPLLGAIISCSSPDYEVIIRNGLIYDGSGNAPISADLGIKGDTIAVIGDLKDKSRAAEIDAELQAFLKEIM